MKMKRISCCLLVVALHSFLAAAQYSKPSPPHHPMNPPQPQYPQQPQSPPQPQYPQQPQSPPQPQYPQQPQSPPQPQYPQQPQSPPQPQYPQQPQTPPQPQYPKQPQYPPQPQYPKQPQSPPQPQYPQQPQSPPQPQYPQQPQSPPQPQYPKQPPSPPQPQYPKQPQSPPQPQYPQQPQSPPQPQYPKQPQSPPQPQYPQQPQSPPQPQYPQQPQSPPQPQYPKQPPSPPQPQYPQQPQSPPQPQYPKQPQYPQPPQHPQYPKQPQYPQPPQHPQYPKQPQQPEYPKQPQYPPQPQNPQQPQYPQTPQSPPVQPQQPFHSCDVSEHYKIQCGVPSISAQECEQINCCYDGHMCYYGKYVTLQCTKDGQFIIVVARDATLPNIDLDTITLNGNGPDCSPVGSTSAFAIYQFPVTACGTVMTDEPGAVVYDNKMTSTYEVAVGPYGAITRDSQYELHVQCKYIGTAVEALIIEVDLVPPPPPVAAPGPLNVELRIANGQCMTKGCNEDQMAYTSYYSDSDYPITKVLRDPVYVEVFILDRTDPNIALTLGRCWANPSPNPLSLPQWDLLDDGCPYHNDHYLTQLIPVGSSSGVQYPTHYSRFVFKMFTFVSGGSASAATKKGAPADAEWSPLHENVYIHCETSVCQISSSNNCQPRCSRKRREISGSTKKAYREESTLVSSNLVIIKNTSE